MYTDMEARRLVLEAGIKLLENRLIARTWGNISARISDTEFVITPSGKPYDGLTPEDLVVVKIKDCSYEGDVKPSSEKGVHAAAYKMRPDCNFIIHTHQFFASAVAADEKSIPGAPCAAYGLPGTKKLMKNMEKSFRENPDDKTFLMAKHGTVILGDDYPDAFELAESLEDACRERFRKKVPDHDVFKYGDFDLTAVATEEFPVVMLQRDYYVMECCMSGLKLKSYVDDFAQIVGPDAACVDNNPAKVKAALKNRNAVLVRGVGAVCTGADRSDAEAVAMIISKNCAAACYARTAKPISTLHSNLMRRVYLTSYSKRKFEDQ